MYGLSSSCLLKQPSWPCQYCCPCRGTLWMHQAAPGADRLAGLQPAAAEDCQRAGCPGGSTGCHSQPAADQAAHDAEPGANAWQHISHRCAGGHVYSTVSAVLLATSMCNQQQCRVPAACSMAASCSGMCCTQPEMHLGFGLAT